MRKKTALKIHKKASALCYSNDTPPVERQRIWPKGTKKWFLNRLKKEYYKYGTIGKCV